MSRALVDTGAGLDTRLTCLPDLRMAPHAQLPCQVFIILSQPRQAESGLLPGVDVCFF